MKQNKNRVFGLAGTVCAALAAIACLIVEYGYEKIILPRGYQWMYPWMQTAVLTGAVVLRYRCRHRSRCLQRTV